MELPGVAEIRRRRRKLGITQQELADLAGVSQSLVARIEKGSVDPRYSKVGLIFNAFDEMVEKGVCAKDIMTKNVFGVQIVMKMGDVTKKMNKHGVSQMPVYDGESVVGSISDSNILGLIGGGIDGRMLSNSPVGENMDEAFPIVNPETPLEVVSALLGYNTAVMVAEKGDVKGVITKADLLKVVHE